MTVLELGSIEVGGSTKDELLDRLRAASISLNRYAQVLFADERFTTAPEVRTASLVALSPADLGLTGGGTYEEIVTRAAAGGLEQCALEVASHLRLHYRDQPVGPYLTVASAKLRTDDEFPNGLYLRHLEDGLWLRGYNAGEEIIYGPEFTDFVFQRH